MTALGNAILKRIGEANRKRGIKPLPLDPMETIRARYMNNRAPVRDKKGRWKARGK